MKKMKKLLLAAMLFVFVLAFSMPASAAGKLAAPTVNWSMRQTGDLTVTWKANSSASGYRVRFYNYATGNSGVRYRSGRTNTSWKIKLDKNAIFRVSVCAYKTQNGVRNYGYERTVYVAAPRTFSATNRTTTALTLKWPKLKGATGYYVLKSYSKESGYSVYRKITSPNTTAIRFTGLSSRSIYVAVVPYKRINGQEITFISNNVVRIGRW